MVQWTCMTHQPQWKDALLCCSGYRGVRCGLLCDVLCSTTGSQWSCDRHQLACNWRLSPELLDWPGALHKTTQPQNTIVYTRCFRSNQSPHYLHELHVTFVSFCFLLLLLPCPPLFATIACGCLYTIVHQILLLYHNLEPPPAHSSPLLIYLASFPGRSQILSSSCFFPQLWDKIWEWPGNEAIFLLCAHLCLFSIELGFLRHTFWSCA